MAAMTREERKIKVLEGLETLVAETEGLTFGYVGNLESWGDDRTWYIWTDKRVETGLYAGNKIKLWSSYQLDLESLTLARQLVKAYRMGRDSVK